MIYWDSSNLYQPSTNLVPTSNETRMKLELEFGQSSEC